MSKFNYNFFSNAIIVFTHIDEIQLGEGIELNTDTLNTKLMEIMTRKSWKQLSELLQRVNNRYMFVNAMNREPGYREEILQKLFELSKPVVKATFHGSTGFTCEDLQTLFKDNSCDISHPKCHLQCTFCDFQCTQDNPNLESFISRVRQLTHGISVIVLLINLNNDLSEQSLRLITGLPEYYKLEGDGESEFWKYTFLLFKFEAEQEDPIGYIHKQCERYGCIRELYEKSGKRATWVTEHMTRDQCINKILEISQIIKQNNEGREYIDVEIVKKMEDKISKLRAKPPPKGADAPGMSYTEILGNIALGVFVFGVSASTGNSKLMTDYLRPAPQTPRKIDDEEFKVFIEHSKND